MATEAVYDYMKTQNRPFSITDLVSNLHNEYSKTMVQKAADQLGADQKIFEKVYGKQKIYCVVQDTKYNAEELMRIDKELQVHANEVENKYQELEKEIKTQEALLADLKNGMTIEEAQREKIKFQESIYQLTQKLDELMEISTTEDLVESKRKANTAFNEYSREYAKRKRLCTEILDCILENYPGSKKSLHEEIGIESKIVQ